MPSNSCRWRSNKKYAGISKGNNMITTGKNIYQGASSIVDNIAKTANNYIIKPIKSNKQLALTAGLSTSALVCFGKSLMTSPINTPLMALGIGLHIAGYLACPKVEDNITTPEKQWDNLRDTKARRTIATQTDPEDTKQDFNVAVEQRNQEYTPKPLWCECCY